jgi:lysozyme
MNRPCCIFIAVLTFFASASGQTSPGEFREPWENPNKALVLDVFRNNRLDFDALAGEPRVAAIIHKASENLIRDRLYAARKVEAKRRGYLWGSYHLGRPGNPIGQADFYLEISQPGQDEVMALDLEDTSAQSMSLGDARIFIRRIREKTGRFPLLYVTSQVREAILALRDATRSEFSKTPLWYARYCQEISCFFPTTVWPSYTLWQFASEINCPSTTTSKRNCFSSVCPLNKCPLARPVPGTDFDMDVNVFNGTVEELRNKWPFIVR